MKGLDETMKKALLFTLFLALTLTSCGGNTPAETGSEPAGTDPAETGESDMFDGMDVKNYDGRSFNWLVPDMPEYEGDMTNAGMNGETYNDAVYSRNQLVSERFNIKINPIIEPYTWDLREQYLGNIRSSVMAEDGAFDMIACQSYIIPSLIVDGMLYNLNDIRELRLNKPWWSQLIHENLTYNGKIYYMSGDISVNGLEFANTIFMNKRLLNEYGLEAPYQLVRDGKWTVEVLESMIKDTARDLNGDGIFDGNDVFGYLYHDNLTINNIPFSLGFKYTKYEGNTVKFNLDNERAAECSAYLADFLKNNPDTHLASKDTGGSGKSMFMGGQGLFYAHFLYRALEFRDMEDDFGILPFPKQDEGQKTYITSMRDSFVGFGIPVDTKDIGFAGTIMEALCVSGSQIIMPAYYDEVLKNKAARDEGSLDMLDIIKDSLSIDFLVAYGIQFNNLQNIFSDVFNQNKNFASHWESQKAQAEKNLASLLESFQ